MQNAFGTVWLLAIVNAVALSAVPMMMLIGSIVGAELAPRESLATFPIAAMVVGTACGVVPAARGMQYLGRPKTFGLFIVNGILACLLLGQAVAMANFALFCTGAFLLGLTAAAMQQIRFAAMECVAPERGPTAASIILCAGVIAAFLGPELALAGKSISGVDYQGSYWLGAACLVVAGILLVGYRPPAISTATQEKSNVTNRELLANPTILLAVLAGASAYMVMSFVMTATPISMHLHHGHSLEDAKWVIQSHIAAMFLPSLLAPWLIRLLGMKGLMVAGLCCYAATITIGLIDGSVLGFWGQLVMLGIGWNFLFLSGTSMLPTGYGPGQQYKAQSLNDSVVFASQAIASLSAGWAISTVSWQALLLLCLMPMLLLIALLLKQRIPSAA